VDYWQPSWRPTSQFVDELTETRDGRIDVGRGTGEPEADVITGRTVKKLGQVSRLLGESDPAELGELAAEVDLMVVHDLAEPAQARDDDWHLASRPRVSDGPWTTMADHRVRLV
jgi:hypothetical protein